MDVERLLQSRVHGKIARFLHRNPNSIGVARDFGIWLGMAEKEIAGALEELAKAKFLNVHQSGATCAYSLTSDPEILKQLSRAVGNKGERF